MSEVVSNRVLDTAYAYVCKAREHTSPNNSIWHLRYHWETLKLQVAQALLTNKYQLSPLQRQCIDGESITQWEATDAVVLKAISMVLTEQYTPLFSKRVTHLKGNGGLKSAVSNVQSQLLHYKHIIKSDVRSFYDSMQHDVVMTQCNVIIKDHRILNIISQYLHRCEINNGEHTLVTCGIPRGCPLSPLMGAIMLKPLDDALQTKSCFYIRYMDDWLIATKTKRQARRFVKIMHQVMHKLKFTLALDKTFIGKISKGLDFLGYRFNHTGLIGLASKTIQNHNTRIAGLYEAGACQERILQYIRRWRTWCLAGLPNNTCLHQQTGEIQYEYQKGNISC